MAAGFKTAYGLDVTAGVWILAKACRSGPPQVVWRAAPDSDAARRTLPAIDREVAKGAAALAVCAPAAQTVVRRLRAPFASARKAARVWPALLDVELPFPVEGAVCDYGSPRVANGGTEAVAAAIRTSDLAAFGEACRAAGGVATHCDAEAPALWSRQLAVAPPARPERPILLVWLGADHVTIVRGRGPEFMAAHVLRASPLAGDPEAFAELWTARVRRIVATHLEETGGPDADLWWAGPGAEDEARVARLRAALPAELSVRSEIHRQPESFLACALACRAIENTGVNFKTGAGTHPALLKKQTRDRRRAYLGVVAASLTVLALNAGEAVLRRQRAATLQRRLTAAAQAIAGSRLPRGQEALLVARAIDRRDAETQAFRHALDGEGVEGRLARALGEARALDVEISRLGLDAAAISIEGSAAGNSAVETLAERLRAQGWAVKWDSPGRTPGGRVRFMIRSEGAGHEG